MGLFLTLLLGVTRKEYSSASIIGVIGDRISFVFSSSSSLNSINMSSLLLEYSDDSDSSELSDSSVGVEIDSFAEYTPDDNSISE